MLFFFFFFFGGMFPRFLVLQDAVVNTNIQVLLIKFDHVQIPPKKKKIIKIKIKIKMLKQDCSSQNPTFEVVCRGLSEIA